MMHYLLPFAAGLLAPGTAAAASDDAPDLILSGGKIITLDDKDSVHQAVAVRADRILATGSDAEMLELSGPATRHLALGGRTVIPGLIDSHIHAIRDGRIYAWVVDLSEARTIDDLLQALGKAAADRAPGEWVVAFGNWHLNQLSERRLPTPLELEKAVPSHPVLLLHQYDSIVLNRPGIKRLGISSQADLSPRLVLDLDDKSVPTGLITTRGASSEVIKVLYRVFPAPTIEDEAKSTAAYFRSLNRVGLTGIIDDGGLAGSDKYRGLFRLWQRSELTLRVRYNVAPNNIEGMAIPPGAELARLQTVLQLIPPRWGDDWLRLLGLGEVLATDMTDSSILEPAAPRTEEAKNTLRELASWAARNGYTLNAHSTHDNTTNAFLDVFEQVDSKTPIAPLRWRISHCEDCTERTLRRMKALGMAWMVQDRLYFDGDDYLVAWGKEIAERSPLLGAARELGLIVSTGSDASVVSPYNPFAGLQWLLDGRTVKGTPTRSAANLLSRSDALRTYTINSAWASFEEASRGTLEAGKLADLVVLDRDYMTIPVSEIGAIRPVLTMVGGKPVFVASGFADLSDASQHR